MEKIRFSILNKSKSCAYKSNGLETRLSITCVMLVHEHDLVYMYNVMVNLLRVEEYSIATWRD